MKGRSKSNREDRTGGGQGRIVQSGGRRQRSQGALGRERCKELKALGRRLKGVNYRATCSTLGQRLGKGLKFKQHRGA